MRIGVLGGTFDPPHRGHLQLALSAADQLELDEVIFMPANRNPMKRREDGGASAKQRLEMVRLLVDHDPRFSVSDLEQTRGGASYTYDTFFELQMVRPADYWFILGADSLRSLPEWKSPEKLIKLTRLAVAVRPPLTPHDAITRIPEDYRAAVDVVQMPAMAISSSDIRERFRRGHSAGDTLLPEVLDYIRRNGLYRS